jgi:hypothetical protein
LWAWQAKGAAIGDVFVATQFANHDRRIPVPVCIAKCLLVICVKGLCMFIIRVV